VKTRNPRNVELVMLVFSLLIAMAAYASVGIAQEGELPAGLVGYGGGLGVLFLTAPSRVAKAGSGR
jgi:hypothetical protein